MFHRYRYRLPVVLSGLIAGSLFAGPMLADHGPGATAEQCIQRIEEIAGSTAAAIDRISTGATAFIAGFGNLAGGRVAETIAGVGTRLVELVAGLGTEFVERVVAFCVHALGEPDATDVANAGNAAVSQIHAAREAALTAIEEALNP